MLIQIHPENPQERLIRQIVEILRNGGVIIYPTDTVYGMGCDINSKKGIEQICRIKGIRPEKAQFSCICENLKILGEYTVQVDTPTYKVLKRALPGPYTFILKASSKIPRHFQSKKKTVGIRVVDHPIPNAIVSMLGNPIVTTSIHSDDEIIDYITDPELIHDRYGKVVDAVIDGGIGELHASTVIDLSQGVDDMEVLREGLGPVEILY